MYKRVALSLSVFMLFIFPINHVRADENTNKLIESEKNIELKLEGVDVVDLKSDKISPQPTSKSITFTANSKGSSQPEYKFWIEENGIWKVLQDYSEKNTYTWIPQKKGNYKITIHSRDKFSKDNYEAYTYLNYNVIDKQTVKTTDLLLNKSDNKPIGTQIELRANSKGSSQPEYKFWIEENGVWKVLQDYSPKNTFIWKPEKEGKYKISVHSKDKYSNVNYEAYDSITYNVIKENIKSLDVSTNINGAQPIGTQIELRANSKGSSQPEYKFWIEENGVWKVLQDYSPKNTFIWKPEKEGKYKISVHSKDKYSKKIYDEYTALSYEIVKEKSSSITVNTNKKSPQPIDTKIELKANSKGSSQPEYKFWIEENGVWKILQDYSPKNTFIWKPEKEGKYKISVHSRDKYSKAKYDSYSAFTYEMKKGKVDKLDVDFDKINPQPIDTPITIKANSEGTNNPEYKFWIEENGAWKILQDYSENNTYEWIPSKIGDYKISVHSRDKYSNIKYEKFKALKYNIKKGEAEAVTLTFDKLGRQPILSDINITAEAKGTNNSLYKFWIEENGIWKVLQDYSENNTYKWTPQKEGKYKISIHAKDKYSKDNYETHTAVYYNIDPAIVYYNNYYNYTYEEMLQLQMKYNPQTDYYGGGWTTAKSEDVGKFLNSNNFLQFYDNPTNKPNNTVTINTKVLNVRSSFNSKSKVLCQVYEGEVYETLDKVNGWYKIEVNSLVGWIHGDYVKVNSNKSELKSLRSVEITGNILNVRNMPSTNASILTQVKKSEVYIIQEEQNGWYKINANGRLGWISSSFTRITNKAPKDMFQFLSLSGNTNTSKEDLNNVLSKKGILDNMGQAFINASIKHNINEMYLISHALLETGNGFSSLAKGTLVDTVDGKKVTPRLVYNMYGIGAYDSNPLKFGSEHAYKAGWFTPEAAIIGGAKFIAEKYVNNNSYKQDTLYKMRWNPSKPGTHQYATDIAWAYKQTSKIKELYDKCKNFILRFDLPKFL